MQPRRERMQSPRFTLRDLWVECPAFFAMLAFVWGTLALLGSLHP